MIVLGQFSFGVGGPVDCTLVLSERVGFLAGCGLLLLLLAGELLSGCPGL